MDKSSCYVFDDAARRPVKRPRIDQGASLSSSLEHRVETYSILWNNTDELIDNVRHELNTSICEDLLDFISEENAYSGSRTRAGFLEGGPDTASNDSVFSSISRALLSKEGFVFICLDTSTTSNLKSLLKNLIRQCKRWQREIADVDHPIEINDIGNRFLNYDLEDLYEQCQAYDIRSVTIAISNVESLDPSVFAEFCRLAWSWHDRIPFNMLLGISTSLHMFLEKIPQSITDCLWGRLFSTVDAKTVINRAFERISQQDCVACWPGPSLARMILQWHNEYGHGKESFARALKYSYMSHFYGNGLTIFLMEDLSYEDVSKDHYQALRNLPSFHRHIEELVTQGSTVKARRLLQNDQDVWKEVKRGIHRGKDSLAWVFGAVRVLVQLALLGSVKSASSFVSMYSRALSSELSKSAPMKEVLLSVGKIASAKELVPMCEYVIDILTKMPADSLDVSPDDFWDVRNDLGDIVDSERGLQTKQRSYPDVRHAFQNLLRDYLDKALSVGANDIFLHELLICDSRSPLREGFSPKPRLAIERALSYSQEYLGCDCCARSEDGGIVPSQPATAILYQLYTETGAYINVADFFAAFRVITQEHLAGEEALTAVFMRAFAELAHMGLIKPSRRRIDHVAKLAYKGL